MTENLAGRGEGLAGLVAALKGVINERDTELDMMHCGYSSGVGREAWHDGVREAWTRFALVKERARQAMAAALEAAAPAGTAPPATVFVLVDTDFEDRLHSIHATEQSAEQARETSNAAPSYRIDKWLVHGAALATPSPQAPQEQCNAFSPTSAREQSLATASDRFNVGDEVDFGSWWQRYVRWSHRTKTEMSSIDLAHEAWIAGRRALGITPVATQEQPARSGAMLKPAVDTVTNLPIGGSPCKVGEDGVGERIWCMECGKSVSTPVPKDTIVRAWVQCPECIEKGKGLCNSQTQK